MSGPDHLRGITIRAARIDDAENMPTVEQSAGMLFATLPDLAWLASTDNRSVSTYRTLIEGGWCWIGETDRGPCAFLAAEPMGDALHVWEIGVALPVQRRGIGAALMHAAIDRAKTEGLRHVTLTTFSDVPWNAPAYQRLGFRRLAALPSGLQAIMNREAAIGLPIDRRCAMRLDLQPAGE